MTSAGWEGICSFSFGRTGSKDAGLLLLDPVKRIELFEIPLESIKRNRRKEKLKESVASTNRLKYGEFT